MSQMISRKHCLCQAMYPWCEKFNWGPWPPAASITCTDNGTISFYKRM